MKKFLQNTVAWKTNACLMYTGSIIVYIIIALCFGQTTVTITTLLSMLAVSAFGTLIQFISFTDVVFKKLKYIWRLVIFAVAFLPMITVVAVFSGWFPADILSSWILFAAIFFIVLFGMTLGFEVYFRLTGKKYDGLLGQYRKSQEEKANKQ